MENLASTRKQIALVAGVGVALIACIVAVFLLTRPQATVGEQVAFKPPTPTLTSEQRAIRAENFVRAYYDFGYDTKIQEYESSLGSLAPKKSFGPLLVAGGYADCLNTKCDMSLTSASAVEQPNGQFKVDYVAGGGYASSMLVSVDEYGYVTDFLDQPASDE